MRILSFSPVPGFCPTSPQKSTPTASGTLTITLGKDEDHDGFITDKAHWVTRKERDQSQHSSSPTTKASSREMCLLRPHGH